MDQNESWHVEIGEDYVFNRPGQGARELEQQHAAGKGGLRRFAERLLDVRTDERAWRRGAEGEEAVGRRLDTLPRDGWAVIHDLTIGTKGANLDHLVIGPPGIFALNTKHLTGKVTVYDRAMLHNGRKTTYFRDSVREATKVQQRLSAAIGGEVKGWGVIVLMGCEVAFHKRPVDCSVIGRRQLPGWFTKMPQQVLSPGAVLELERAARMPSTWLGSSASQPEPAAAASEPTGGQPPSGAPAQPPSVELTIRRWRRFGHDRLYANHPDGMKVGWIDVRTGEITIEAEAFAGEARQALLHAREELSRGDTSP